MHVKKYLDEIEGHGADSEIALYTPLATHVLKGILGYPAEKYSINKTGTQGTPDIRLYSGEDNSEWIITEVKLRDDEIRDDEKRRKIWNEQILKKGYLKSETVFVLLCAPRTFYVCNLEGDIIDGCQIEVDRILHFKSKERLSFSDENVRNTLNLITFEESLRSPQYEEFRNGNLKGGYIQITAETIPELHATFNYAIVELKYYCRKIFDGLKIEYDDASEKIRNLETKLAILGSANDRERGNILSKIRYQRNRHRLCLQLFENDFPQFKHDQTYAGTEKETQFEDIFITNTAHVALSRLFFVRICEDIGLTTRKISNEGPGVWRRFVKHLKDRYQDLIALAFRDVSYVYTKLFEDTVFDWFGKGNSELNTILVKILFRLNAYSFTNVSRDLFGRIYECFRPPAERKRLGEYYTPEEVVDFIIDRTGISEDRELMTKVILDPSCGSFTFGVRTLTHLLKSGKNLNNRNKIELVKKCLVGFDINPFSTFLSHLSILFALLDIYFEEKKADENYRLEGFNVHNLNSLTYYLGRQVDMLSEEKENAQFEKNSFDYVIGNPPFVRNERLPREDRVILDEIFQDIKSGNTDLSAYFLYAVLNDYLREGGTLGMVSPIGMANTKMSLKFREYAKEYHISEVVSLEWMTKEVFPDADIIPMLLFIEKVGAREKETIRIVTGLRNKSDLNRMISDTTFSKYHVSEIDYRRWLNLSPTGDWPLEIKGKDVDVLEKLRKCETMEKAVQVNFAIKIGTEFDPVIAQDSDKKDENLIPFLKGHHICSYAISESEELFDLRKINEVSDKSVWGDLSFYRKNLNKFDNTGSGRTDYENTGLEFNHAPKDTLCCLIPKISTTLNAAVVDPLKYMANDSAMVAVPYQYNARVISAVINSDTSRYFSFLLLRSAILLRRRSTWAPRIIKNLPMPILSKAQAKKVNQLVWDAEDIFVDTYLDEITLYRTEVEGKKLIKAGFLGVSVAKSGGVIDREDLENAQIIDNKLCFNGFEIAAEDHGLLYLLKIGLLSSEAAIINPEIIENIPLPEEKSFRNELRDGLLDVAKNLDAAKRRIEVLTDRLNEIIASALKLTPKEHEIIKSRCGEFPLSITVGKPRYIWSSGRKRQSRRIYEKGERFKRIYREK